MVSDILMQDSAAPGKSALITEQSSSAQEFAKKYVDNLDQVPASRPSYVLLSRGLKEFKDPMLNSNV